MMCRIANGGCGTEETHCPVSISKVPKPEDIHAPLAQIGINFYAQACKALAVVSPFDLEDVQKKSSATVTTLPSGLASCLFKQSDSRKKHKKSYSASDTKKNKEKVRVNSIWSQTEDCFRGVCLDDIERLNEASPFRGNSLISIPYPGNNNSNNNNNNNIIKRNNHSGQDANHIVEVDGESVNEVSQNQQEYDIACMLPQYFSGIEWLLGSRSKTYLTSERSSKKRKPAGGETGFEKLFVAQPVKDGEPFTCCDYCSMGGTDNQLNRLMVCTSCGVAVHQRCYGVQQNDDAGWLCSWCRVKIDGEKSTDSDRHCLLCPQQSGALKPVKNRGVGDDDGGHIHFAHLFCCQWMTEVYIEDTKCMEPVMNIEGVKDAQKKLICYLCKVKCGACVRCSHGSCQTTFHPVCAREARHRMEIWGKFGCDDVEMRAFCLKHSEAQKEGSASCEDGVLNTSSNVKSKTDFVDVADVKGSNTVEDVKVSDSSNLTLLLKKKNLKLKFLSARISNGEKASGIGNAITRAADNNVGSFSVKLGPPRTKVKGNIRVLMDNSLILSLKRSSADGVLRDEDKNGGKFSGQESSPDSRVKTSTESCPVSDLLVGNTTEQKGDAVKCSSPSQIGCSQVDRPIDFNSSITENNSRVAIRTEASPDSYVHPLILMREQHFSETKVHEVDGSGVSCNQQSKNSATESGTESGKTERVSIINVSPVDEVEGELVYYQHQLLCNAVARKHINDVLISKVTKCLPQEIEDVREHYWDSVFVSQFLSDLKRVKKRGQKERRHKEAQAVSAAAAASSRPSSLRKDTVDGSAHQENILEAKEAHPKLSVTWTSHEISTMKNKGHSRVCDVCRRTDTVLNPIIVCSSCKVTVHIDCYRSIKDSTGPWFCELCEDIRPSHVAECRLCGGTTGAFRKSTDGQWVHAFCAEWILESTFRRGQVKPIDCVDTVFKGNDICLVCSRKEGVCLQCNYGHCQRTFHPTCGRSACLFMNVRTIGGKLQHKAYCDKHSLVERTKAETQKYGVEEWNSMKKVRVELERLRLICERVIRREKLKRELVICSHDTLRWNRESISSFMRVCTAYESPDVSSESATTSLKGGYTNRYKSCSETIQRSDDVTIDSSVTGKRRIRFLMAMDTDQKTDASSTSQIFTHIPTVRPLASKQILHRPSHTASDDVDKFLQHGKHTETFEKELVMTSDQASMRNQQLPKGFVYVPIRCLSNEEEIIAAAEDNLGQDE